MEPMEPIDEKTMLALLDALVNGMDCAKSPQAQMQATKKGY